MILIVDDTPENIFSLKHLLEINRFNVDTAGSGEEALKKVLKNDYSLIILDVQMPVMDGFEVAETIGNFNKTKDIPIIFLSAINIEKKYIKKGYSSGAVDYLTKPVDADIFILKVKTLHKLYEQKRELIKIQESLSQEVETRLHIEAELREKMGELATILESIPQLAFGMNPDGKIEYVNQQWFLYSSSEKALPEFSELKNETKSDIAKALKSGKGFTKEVFIKHLLKKQFRSHVFKFVPVRQDNKIIRWVGTFNDIHEQKAANTILKEKVQDATKKLTEQNFLLQSRNEELQQFVFIASHDLKEPLRKIQMFISQLENKSEISEDKALHYLSRIKNSAGRMAKLITDLLDYSRLSDSFNLEVVNLNDIIAEVLQDLELIVEEKNAIITVDKLPVVNAISSQIRQVIQNIIINALKFSKKDTAPIIKIYSKTDSENHFQKIYFEDNGIGFNEMYLSKIFTIFQRLNLRDKFEGTGMGLAIAKKIMEKHNGFITATSREGVGSTFILSFPN